MKNNTNEKSTEGFLFDILLSSLGAYFIAMILFVIIGYKLTNKSYNMELKKFIENHKDLVNELNKRIKETNIINKINYIFKLLIKNINKIPGYKITSELQFDNKKFNSVLNDIFVKVSKTGKLKEELNNMSILKDISVEIKPKNINNYNDKKNYKRNKKFCYRSNKYRSKKLQIRIFR